MQRVRVTVKHNPNDPVDDLQCAARVRRDLWSHSPIEVDPDNPRHRTQRDEDRNAYFEFATDMFSEVERVLDEYGYNGRAEAKVVAEDIGRQCANCTNIVPTLTTICPICSFRDIEPCPHCKTDVPREAYLTITEDLSKCPKCHQKVCFQFHDPLFDEQGSYVQPLILVVRAEVSA